MNKKNAGRAAAISVVCACLLLAAIYIPAAAACARKDKQPAQEHDMKEMSTFMFSMQIECVIEYDFVTDELKVRYTDENFDEQTVGATLDDASAEKFEKAVIAFCDDVFAHESDFFRDPGDEASATWWYFEAGFPDGSIRRGAANSEGFRAHPEGWDDFVETVESATDYSLREAADECIPEFFRR